MNKSILPNTRASLNRRNGIFEQEIPSSSFEILDPYRKWRHPKLQSRLSKQEFADVLTEIQNRLDKLEKSLDKVLNYI